ncbi:hypothetical protein FHW84_001776 [Dyella sp. SG562]|nr:hypothetical protein [Dyella sp. SG562]NII73207.1 hypothetical protein [Dyella sp. SG562]
MSVDLAWLLLTMGIAILYIAVFGFIAYVDECSRRANKKDNSHE